MSRAKKPPRVKRCAAFTFPDACPCVLAKGHAGPHIAIRLDEPKKKGARK